jgi:hypothetical protein
MATNPGWTPNQWAGYSLFDSTANSQHASGYIISNTHNAIVYATYQGQDSPGTVILPGDNIEVRLLMQALDQPGMGKGDLITGAPTPINSVLGYAAWPRQNVERIYVWNDEWRGATTVATSFSNAGFPTIKNNVHYKNLGNRLAPNTIPDEVKNFYNADDPNNPGTPINGVPYTQEFQYPHPMVTGGP